MTQEALKNIVAQAEEALAGRRLLDALALTDTILKDIASDMPLTATAQVREYYEAMLHYTIRGGHDPELESNLLNLFQMAITELQNAIVTWHVKQGTTTFGRLVKAFAVENDFDFDALLDQLHRIGRSHLGKPAYHEALDAAFGFLWIMQIPSDSDDKLFAAINKLDDFAVSTLISGTMLGTIETCSPPRLRLLVRLARARMGTPIKSRALFSLYLAYARWQQLMAFYPDIEADIRKIFTTEADSADIAALSDSFIREQLTPQAQKQSDEFLPKITKMFEKQIKWLDSHDDEKPSEKASEDSQEKMKVNIIRIEGDDDKLMNTLSMHARRVDMLRTNGFDINSSNFGYMKRFDFFDHVAHYFYPFSTQVPQIAKILDKMKGKSLTFQVMKHSHFCSSDAYSYLLMMNFVESSSHRLKNMIEEQLSELENEFEVADKEFVYESMLDPYTDYAQSVQRFFNSPNHKSQRPDPFLLNSSTLPPLMPALTGAFHDYASVEDSVNSLLMMGCTAEALTILTWAEDTFGATASLLRQKGKALMHMEMWNRAIEALSRAQLLDEDPETAHLIARCHESLGAWEAALSQLQIVEEATDNLDPEIATEIVLCLIQSARWDDAANRLFQLEFEGHKSRTIERSIGWCSLHQGKYQRAEQYYTALTSQNKKPSWQDLLNLGHSLWLQERRDEAIQAYRRFTIAFDRAKNKQAFRNWQEAFSEDATTLLSAKSSKAEIAVLIDAIALG